MRPIFMILLFDVVFIRNQETEFLETLLDRNTIKLVFQKYTSCHVELGMISQSIQDLFQIYSRFSWYQPSLEEIISAAGWMKHHHWKISIVSSQDYFPKISWVWSGPCCRRRPPRGVRSAWGVWSWGPARQTAVSTKRDGLCEALGEHFFSKHAPDDLTIVLVGVHRAYLCSDRKSMLAVTASTR